MRHVALVLLLLLLVIGGGLFMGWVWYALTGKAKQRTKEMDKYLSWAGLTIGPQARGRLERHFARRAKRGAVAAGAGFALGIPLAAAMQGRTGDQGGMLSAACSFVGLCLGRATSGMSLPEPTGAARVSSLQPHGLTDYLRQREIGVEIGLAVLGIAACLAGGTALGGTRFTARDGLAGRRAGCLRRRRLGGSSAAPAPAAFFPATGGRRGSAGSQGHHLGARPA